MHAPEKALYSCRAVCTLSKPLAQLTNYAVLIIIGNGSVSKVQGLPSVVWGEILNDTRVHEKNLSQFLIRRWLIWGNNNELHMHVSSYLGDYCGRL